MNLVNGLPLPVTPDEAKARLRILAEEARRKALDYDGDPIEDLRHILFCQRISRLSCGRRLSMNLDNGLPLPGRELDLEVARILGYEIVSRHRDATQETYILDCGVPGTNLWIIGPGMVAPKKWTPSTTAAFFQVMEADSGVHTWETMERYVRRDCYAPDGATKEELRLYVLLDTVVDRYQVSVWVSDYLSREKAYAHAVCCCLWKAERDD